MGFQGLGAGEFIGLTARRSRYVAHKMAQDEKSVWMEENKNQNDESMVLDWIRADRSLLLLLFPNSPDHGKKTVNMQWQKWHKDSTSTRGGLGWARSLRPGLVRPVEQHRCRRETFVYRTDVYVSNFAFPPKQS
jgi:hypothetical protein